MTAVSNPAIPDLLYSDTEDSLREALVDALERSADWSATLARTESDDTVDAKLWQALSVDMGLTGLPIPEGRGGSDATWREVAVVLEELGHHVAAVPFLGSAVTATALLDEVGESELLAELVAGGSVAALAVTADTTPWSEVGTDLSARAGQLTGMVQSVTDALSAEWILAVAGDELYVVAVQDVSLTPVVSLDMTRQLVDVTFDGAPGRRIASGPAVREGVERALMISVAMLASEQLGVAETCLSMTVDYLKQRRQFGRVLGSYQALKHRLADLWVEITQARAVARYAAGCAAEMNEDLLVASSLASTICGRVALKAAEECVQMHGGIGFTWEHPAHLLLKRAKSSSLMFGGSDAHTERLGSLVGITMYDDEEDMTNA